MFLIHNVHPTTKELVTITEDMLDIPETPNEEA